MFEDILELRAVVAGQQEARPSVVGYQRHDGERRDAVGSRLGDAAWCSRVEAGGSHLLESRDRNQPDTVRRDEAEAIEVRRTGLEVREDLLSPSLAGRVNHEMCHWERDGKPIFTVPISAGCEVAEHHWGEAVEYEMAA